jgi:hypothetical protein
MECGQFSLVDVKLLEAKHILKTKGDQLRKVSEERVVFYWGKYYHLQGKNSWRSYFHQRSYETFKDGILYLSKY